MPIIVACGGDDDSAADDHGNTTTLFTYEKLVGDFSWKLSNVIVENGEASFIHVGKTIKFYSNGSCSGLIENEKTYVISGGRIQTFSGTTKEPLYNYTLLEETANRIKVRIEGALNDDLQAILFFEKVVDKNDNPINNEEQQKGDNYYVKYEASSYAGNGTFGFIVVEYTSEKYKTVKVSKENRKSKGASWEGVFGPFKKGDSVKLTVSGSYQVKGRISVAINNEQFAVKTEREGNNSISLSYTIE